MDNVYNDSDNKLIPYTQLKETMVMPSVAYLCMTLPYALEREATIRNSYYTRQVMMWGLALCSLTFTFSYVICLLISYSLLHMRELD